MNRSDAAVRPSIVPRREIPTSKSDEHRGLEVRPFHAHELLESVVPCADVALAWTHAEPGQTIDLRSHSKNGLLVVLDGNALLLGDIPQRVSAGDVVTIPANHEYGFADIGPHALHALHITFREDQAKARAESRSKQELLSHNEMRAQRVLGNPFYVLLSDKAASSPRTRALIPEALRVFSDAFQMILFTRQATCRDQRFSTLFHRHMVEELGHNELLHVTGTTRAATDPILRATSSWFCHQMLVLDNAGKAIVNLVLETAGYHFHTVASSVFSTHQDAEYFKSHAEDDEHHKEIGLDQLEGLHPEGYLRLHRVLEDTWDMFEVMTKRIAYLVELEEKSS